MPAAVFAGRVYVALALPFETVPDVADDPTGVVPFISVKVTLPSWTMPAGLITFASRVKAWVPELVIAQVFEAMVLVAAKLKPDKAIDCGEFPASSVKESEAIRTPPAEG